jgi:hypothetical protein
MNAAATCPWCGAILADPRPEVCPSCNAALVPRISAAADRAMTSGTGGTAGVTADTGEPLLPGLTIAGGSQTSLLRATDPLLAEAITTSPFREDESEEGVQPPSDEVRLLIRQMELERLVAERAADEDVPLPGLTGGAVEIDAYASEGADEIDPLDPVDGTAGPDVDETGGTDETDGTAEAPGAAARPAGPAGPSDTTATPPGNGAAEAVATGDGFGIASRDEWSPAPSQQAPKRQPAPGPSFVREETVVLRSRDGTDRRITLGMSAPSVMDDGWWLAHLWAADADGIVDALAVAPVAGPPPTPPLLILGPAFAGALSGLLAQEDGRQLIRFRLPPAPDERRPWERPLLVWLAVKWDVVRASVMRPNELAREVLRAFSRAIEAASKPG